VIGQDKFVVLFAEEFDLDESSVSPETALLEDLGFDSLQYLRAAVFMEMLLSGIEISDGEIVDGLTVGGLYRRYCLAVTDQALASAPGDRGFRPEG
jgi:acyl carrier protein